MRRVPDGARCEADREALPRFTHGFQDFSDLVGDVGRDGHRAYGRRLVMVFDITSAGWQGQDVAVLRGK